MEIQIFMGEWMNTLQQRMFDALDGDCFYLPTPMHLHAFLVVKEANFPNKNFKVEVAQDSQA